MLATHVSRGHANRTCCSCRRVRRNLTGEVHMQQLPAPNTKPPASVTTCARRGRSRPTEVVQHETSPPSILYPLYSSRLGGFTPSRCLASKLPLLLGLTPSTSTALPIRSTAESRKLLDRMVLMSFEEKTAVCRPRNGHSGAQCECMEGFRELVG